MADKIDELINALRRYLGGTRVVCFKKKPRSNGCRSGA